MSQVINTNVLSLTAQRNLQTSQSELATSLQRLSSGLRINSAKDDAAGLAISERFTTQIRGLNQAIRNANDGISLSQTGEAALDTVTENLQRIRELAVQSVNATNSDTDRATLQQEVDQRLSEIDRIASQTSFNGRNVLDGSFGSALFQVGANVGETISLDLDASVRPDDIGSVANALSVDLDTITGQTSGTLTFEEGEAVATGTSTLSVTLTAGNDALSFEASADDGGAISAGDLAASLEADAGVTIEDGTEAEGFTFSFGGEASLTDAIANDALVISRGDNETFTITQSSTGDTFAEGAGFTGPTGLAVVTDDESSGDSTQQSVIVDSSGTGEAFTITLGDNDPLAVADGTYNTATELLDAINTALGSNATASLDSDNVLTITTGENIAIDQTGVFATDGSTQQDVFTSSLFTTGGSLDDVSVSTVDDANDAIGRVDAALSSVSDLRSTFGAIQNRFESTIENLTTTTENLEASRSRIRDADFAQETANLTRVQILQQAGISVLSQANVQPQNVLALLQ